MGRKKKRLGKPATKFSSLAIKRYATLCEHSLFKRYQLLIYLPDQERPFFVMTSKHKNELEAALAIIKAEWLYERIEKEIGGNNFRKVMRAADLLGSMEVGY